MSDREPLTDDEGQVVTDLWLARQAGLAGALKPECYPAAHTLHERGWISRRFEGDLLVWEFLDAGLAALDLNALTESVKGREN